MHCSNTIYDKICFFCLNVLECRPLEQVHMPGKLVLTCYEKGIKTCKQEYTIIYIFISITLGGHVKIIRNVCTMSTSHPKTCKIFSSPRQF